MDLTPLTDWLATLGPWGMLAALAVGYLAPKLLGALKPKPTPPAAPTIPPDGILGAIMDALRRRIRAADPNADADAEVVSILVTAYRDVPDPPRKVGVGGIPE